MSRITLFQGLLMNLAEEIEDNRFEYLTKEEAYKELRRLTGQDFGYNVRKWRQWIKENEVSAKYPRGKSSEQP